ncbi:mitochondrion autophagy protein [Malassezia pachydermatis]
MPVRSYIAPSVARTLPRTAPRAGFIASLGLVAGGSLLAGQSLFSEKNHIECQSAFAKEHEIPMPGSKPEPESIVNLYKLSFGTVCGLCAGIFIKKGLKLIAVLLGASYVLLQYLASKRLITIDWKSLQTSYNSSVDRLAGPADKAKSGMTQYPLVRIWNRMVEFLTSNFQERATFIAGLVLGLRLG